MLVIRLQTTAKHVHTRNSDTYSPNQSCSHVLPLIFCCPLPGVPQSQQLFMHELEPEVYENGAWTARTVGRTFGMLDSFSYLNAFEVGACAQVSSFVHEWLHQDEGHSDW